MKSHFPTPSNPLQRGFSLIELMISVVISMLILAGLSAMLVNVSGTNSELAKTNSQIENGRFAVNALTSDLVHAGFWGAFVPQFDDLNYPFVPSDTPTAIPDPCLAVSAANWDFAHKNNLIGVPIQAGPDAPGSCTLADKAANTDYLVVRHAAPCVPTDDNCDADVPGSMYFQSSVCSNANRNLAHTSGNNATTLALKPPSSTSNTLSANNAYIGMTVRIIAGTGQGQTGTITAYNGTTYTATVTPAWTTVPDATSEYTIIESVLDTANFTLHQRGPDCQAAPAAEKRKFVSNIYYIRNYANTAGDGIPTLVRSSFDADPAGVSLEHGAAVPLVEGIERMVIELGIDDTVARCGFDTPTDYTEVVDKWNPTTCLKATDTALNSLPQNRGDGNPDRFKRCTTASPCTLAELRDAVSVKLYLLVRNTEASVGYSDTKTYCMAAIPVGGSCADVDIVGPFADSFKRHMFTTSVRLTSISGRRETP